MASEESQEAFAIRAPLESKIHWVHGAVAGLVAAVAMGIAITLVDASVLGEAISGMYGFEGSLVAGWVAHLLHGTLFGVIFAVILSDPILYRVSEWTWKTILAGAVFGLVLALAGAGLIMPVWLAAAGVESSTSIPNVSVPLVLYHLLYGLVLGAVFRVFDGDADRSPDE